MQKDDTCITLKSAAALFSGNCMAKALFSSGRVPEYGIPLCGSRCCSVEVEESVCL